MRYNTGRGSSLFSIKSITLSTDNSSLDTKQAVANAIIVQSKVTLVHNTSRDLGTDTQDDETRVLVHKLAQLLAWSGY